MAFINGHKSDIGQPCVCTRCHKLFTKMVDDEDMCWWCQDAEDEQMLSDRDMGDN